MELPEPRTDDVLTVPIRGRLFSALADLRRPATTAELATLVGRHPNTVRTHLRALADVGLLEARDVRQTRGRPRHEWAIAADARPAGEAPRAYGQLGRWLARAIGPQGAALEKVEEAGREIGRELAPAPSGRGLADAMRDALSALGFQPSTEVDEGSRLCFVLGNCPYRDAVRENQPVVCTLHKGITRGLLDKLEPKARLADFVARDPDQAGCQIALEGVGATAG